MLMMPCVYLAGTTCNMSSCQPITTCVLTCLAGICTLQQRALHTTMDNLSMGLCFTIQWWPMLMAAHHCIGGGKSSYYGLHWFLLHIFALSSLGCLGINLAIARFCRRDGIQQNHLWWQFFNVLLVGTAMYCVKGCDVTHIIYFMMCGVIFWWNIIPLLQNWYKQKLRVHITMVFMASIPVLSTLRMGYFMNLLVGSLWLVTALACKTVCLLDVQSNLEQSIILLAR
jgi:hypothetical protein